MDVPLPTLRWIVAAIHLLALGIGLGAIVVRALSGIQAVLVVAMVFAATAMARGLGY